MRANTGTGKGSNDAGQKVPRTDGRDVPVNRQVDCIEGVASISPRGPDARFTNRRKGIAIISPSDSREYVSEAGTEWERCRVPIHFTRKVGQKIVIDPDTIVTVARIKGGQVHLVIEADRNRRVYRQEVAPADMLRRAELPRGRKQSGAEPEKPKAVKAPRARTRPQTLRPKDADQ